MIKRPRDGKRPEGELWEPIRPAFKTKALREQEDWWEAAEIDRAPTSSEEKLKMLQMKEEHLSNKTRGVATSLEAEPVFLLYLLWLEFSRQALCPEVVLKLGLKAGFFLPVPGVSPIPACPVSLTVSWLFI